MKWGEAKLICLQTMYANEGVTILQDDSTEEYLNAMPGKANEAMMQLSLVGRPLLKEAKIAVGLDADEGDAIGWWPGVADGAVQVRLKEYLPDFRALHQLMLDSHGIYGDAEDYRVVGEDTLVLPGDVAGVYTVIYKAYPTTVSRDTADETVLDVHEECASLVPIYMAAELYKDDDLALATVLRNEYEDGLQKIRAAWAESGGGGYAVAMRRNTTGWW